MMTKAEQARLAIHAWDYALNLCIRSLTDDLEREALVVCEERPTIANIRAVLAIGRYRPWRTLVESALVEIGLAAIEDVLGEADHVHDD